MLGELVRAQEEAKGILAHAKESEDRTFEEAAVSSAPFGEEVTTDLAVIFNSLFKREEISFADIQLSVDFQDYLDSLGYEIRRKARRK